MLEIWCFSRMCLQQNHVFHCLFQEKKWEFWCFTVKSTGFLHLVTWVFYGFTQQERLEHVKKWRFVSEKPQVSEFH